MMFHFVLIEPAVPGNVGAAVRALKTMGFCYLHLVNPCNHLCEEARRLAHGSHDLLESAKIHHDFNDLKSQFDLVIGTTANTKRSAKADFVPLNKLTELILNKKETVKSIAIVFGREESGLSNQELRLCDIVSTVPLKTTYPSLNLAQAVMLYAYELSKLDYCEPEPVSRSEASFNILKETTRKLLNNIDMNESSNIYPRIMERMMFLSDDDIHLLHSVLAKLNKKHPFV
jgi:tRNA/rRNA methyltransferase